MSLRLAREAVSGGGLSIVQVCRALSIPRATYYRGLVAKERSGGDKDVRDAILNIAGRMVGYGYRRITHELRRQGRVVNHKRVRRIMREERLLCRSRRRFTRTTDSTHGFPTYPNLARNMTLTGINQLWVADITYVHLDRATVYLAVILDAFGRRGVGWDVQPDLRARLTVNALKMAVANRRPAPGLVHHSDRGTQYACNEYIDLLHQHGIQPSMSRAGCPYDNARAESFIRTIKCEEVYLKEYRDLTHVRNDIAHFIDTVYNRERLHSALGYLPPAEFEAIAAATEATPAGKPVVSL